MASPTAAACGWRFEPTYEGWKLASRREPHQGAGVLSLPMRDGNGVNSSDTLTSVLSF